MKKSNTHIHFIGICGIGMSGIAKILRQQGYTVSGCDLNPDLKIVNDLKSIGCQISLKHDSEICNDQTINTVVYNSFISHDHVELKRAREQKKLILHRAQILANIMAEKESIGVAGSHGKTSTSALMSHILLNTNYDPTVVVGGIINSLESNACYGKGKYLVAETDESDRSFLLLPKKYTIVTNIDFEHLETYKDFDDIKQTFLKFINSVPSNGMNVLCIDDNGIKDILPYVNAPYITYGQSNNADIQVKNICLNIDSSTFDIYQKSSGIIFGNIVLNQPGIHYVLNAVGAVAMSLHLNIPFIKIEQAIASFSGVDRRFSYKGISSMHGAQVFDDYGHHPVAIDYAIIIARKKAKNNLVVVFQPHRFSRTKHLWNEFIKLFSKNLIDTLIITDIYSAFEAPIESVTSQNLVKEIKAICPNKNIFYCPISSEMNELQDILDKTLKKDDLLLLLGAGKINSLSKKLIK